MLVLSVAFIPVLLIPDLDRRLSPTARSAFGVADWAIWAAFALEYLARLVVAPDRWRYVKSNPVDLLIIALPLLRPLRILRSVRLLRGVRVLRAGAATAGAVAKYRQRLIARAALFATGTSVIVIFVAAAVELDLERDAPSATIRSYGDALWWAMSTVTTVGYGDRYPVTGAGRVVAAAVMLIGIAVIGLVTAAVAAWFVRLSETPKEDDLKVDSAMLLAEIRALRGEVAMLRAERNDKLPKPAVSSSASQSA